MMTWDEDIRAVLWLRGGIWFRDGTTRRIWEVRMGVHLHWAFPREHLILLRHPEIGRETFSRPISHSGFLIAYSTHCSVHSTFPADSPEKPAPPPLPPSLSWFYDSFSSVTLAGEWESPQTPVSPSAPTGQWVTSPLHAVFPWNLPLSPAVCSCGLHEPSGSQPPLPSHLCMATSLLPPHGPCCTPLPGWTDNPQTQDPATPLQCPQDQARVSHLSVPGRPHHPQWPGRQFLQHLLTLFPLIPRLPFKLYLPPCLQTCLSLSCSHIFIPASHSIWGAEGGNLFYFSLWKILLTQGPAPVPHLSLSLLNSLLVSRDGSSSNSSSAYCLGCSF